MRSLKKRLVSGEITVGSWVQLAHPANCEIMCRAGFDWLTVDLEHSVITIREAEEMIRVIELCDVPALVRLSDNDPVQIKRVMDAGATGIIVPMVKTPDDAERAVAAVRYPPHGNRGVGLARAQGYGEKFSEYAAWLPRESVVIVQIEHIDGVTSLDAILSVTGVDGFIVGPYDLSGSLGVPGQLTHPKMKKALSDILVTAQRYPRLPPGFHVVAPEPRLVAEKISAGFRFIGYSTDMLFLGESCRSGVRDIKRSIPHKPNSARGVDSIIK